MSIWKLAQSLNTGLAMQNEVKTPQEHSGNAGPSGGAQNCVALVCTAHAELSMLHSTAQFSERWQRPSTKGRDTIVPKYIYLVHHSVSRLCYQSRYRRL